MHPFQTSVEVILEFLTELFHSGAGYSTINTARSALSTFISVDNFSVGQHPLVKHFLRGVFNLRPSLPKYAVTWDANVLLSFLKTLSPVKLLNLTKLSYKLVTLLALLSGQRGQTLHLLDIKHMKITEFKVTIFVNDLLKHSKPGRHLDPICLKAFAPDRRLCIITVLNEYLKRTARLRKKDNTKLFVSIIAPHQGVSRDTIARWMKTTMKLAGIDVSVFAPHSVRSAAASAAYKSYVPIDTILRTVGWSSETTFTKYYKKPVTKDNQFAEAILHGSRS